MMKNKIMNIYFIMLLIMWKDLEKKNYILYLKNFVKVECFRNLIDLLVFKYGCL